MACDLDTRNVDTSWLIVLGVFHFYTRGVRLCSGTAKSYTKQSHVTISGSFSELVCESRSATRCFFHTTIRHVPSIDHVLPNTCTIRRILRPPKSRVGMVGHQYSLPVPSACHVNQQNGTWVPTSIGKNAHSSGTFFSFLTFPHHFQRSLTASPRAPSYELGSRDYSIE